MSKMIARLSAIAAANGGASAVEFALVAAFLLLPMTLGLYDFGTAMYRWMEVGNAARAGAAYANINGYNWGNGSGGFDTTANACGSSSLTANFTCASQGATNLGTAVIVKSSTTPSCGCQSGTTFTAHACPVNAASCPGKTFVTLGTITATYNYKPLFNYLGFGPTNGYNLRSQVTVLTN